MLDEELLHAYRRYISTDAALAAAGAEADERLRQEAARAKLTYHNLFEAFLQGVHRGNPEADHRIVTTDA